MEKIKACVLSVVINDYNSYSEAFDDMTAQNVKHLGWLNAGIKLPKEHVWVEVYSNYTGTSCLYCDIWKRVSYSVDMGD